MRGSSPGMPCKAGSPILGAFLGMVTAVTLTSGELQAADEVGEPLLWLRTLDPDGRCEGESALKAAFREVLSLVPAELEGRSHAWDIDVRVEATEVDARGRLRVVVDDRVVFKRQIEEPDCRLVSAALLLSLRVFINTPSQYEEESEGEGEAEASGGTDPPPPSPSVEPAPLSVEQSTPLDAERSAAALGTSEASSQRGSWMVGAFVGLGTLPGTTWGLALLGRIPFRGWHLLVGAGYSQTSATLVNDLEFGFSSTEFKLAPGGNFDIVEGWRLYGEAGAFMGVTRIDPAPVALVAGSAPFGGGMASATLSWDPLEWLLVEARAEGQIPLVRESYVAGRLDRPIWTRPSFGFLGGIYAGVSF